MANQDSHVQELKGWDKVVAWYASKAYAVGIIYSLGAAVVIVGALFKIMHWPGAGIVLTAGMCTEAFLFIIGIFEKPHAVYNWENVFPQVIGHEAKPLNVGGAVAAAAPAASASFSMPSVKGLEEDDVKALKESIKSIATTAGSIADLSKLAEGTNNLSDKLNAAAEATGKFAGSQAVVAEAATRLGENYVAAAGAVEAIKNDSEAAAKAQAEAAKNIAAINAAYEISLHAAQQLSEQNAAAAQSSAAFAQAQAQLAKQVADLNKVYGGMLSAIA